MRFAYADPPYLGCGRLYKEHHPDWKIWDSLDTHKSLIDRLIAEYPDGWALSASEPSLRYILPLTPVSTRTSPWVKPFCSFKPNVNPAHAWEPVLWYGGRKRARYETTIRDYHSANITLQKGCPGAKPESFVWWMTELLGARPGIDTLDDLFPGTGIVSKLWKEAAA